MYCYFCGKENDDSKKFCKYCGKSLHPEMEDNEKENNAETEPEKVNQEQAQIEDKQKKPALFNNILLITVIVLLVIVLAAVGVCLAVFLKNNGSDKEKSDHKEKIFEEAAEDDPEEDDEKNDAIQMTDENDDEEPDETEESDRVEDREEKYNRYDQAEYEEYEEPAEEEEQEKEYILPDSSNRKLDRSDLEGLTKDECRIARNEIYARHGRRFKDEELQKYFNSQEWYRGTVDPDDFNEKELSSTELANLDLITKYEKEEGYR